MVPDASEGTPIMTNPVYADLFTKLGCGSVVVAVVLGILIPTLRKMIRDEQPPAASGEPVASGVPAA
jgi:POT family proton-dependent oligopeptide transporter